MYKQKKKQTRKRKYKQKHRRTHKRKGLKKRKKTRRKRRGGWPWSNKPSPKVDDYGRLINAEGIFLNADGSLFTQSASRAAPLPVQLEAKRRYPSMTDLADGEGKEADDDADPTRIVIMASHQARIQCELNKFNLLGKPKDKNGESIRFKNGAVLKLMIRGTIMRVELFYDGELTPNKSDHKGFMNGKKPYFVTQKNFVTTPEDKKPKPKGQYIFYTQQSNIDFASGALNFDIYLIRHGEGTHNISKWGPVKGIVNQAADLTDDGVEQAKRTGLALETIITSATVPITLASSDIPRAINTMIQIRKKSLYLVDDKPIHIVPCSHEIPHKKPPCDGRGMAAGENDSQGYNYYTKGKRNIDYEEYFEFYNGTSRSGQKLRGGVMRRDRSRCRGSSMFKQIYELVVDEKGNAKAAAKATGHQEDAASLALAQYIHSGRVTNTWTPPVLVAGEAEAVAGEAVAGEAAAEDVSDFERATDVSRHATNGDSDSDGSVD
jgi:hypothetical protein